jgi:uncharacterized radical SAM superfamily protein
MATQRHLCYIQNLNKSTNMRLGSLSKKVDNTINLAFHMVAQQDSKRVTKDSSSMRVIATVTMVFLPGTAVAVSLSLRNRGRPR